MREIFFSHTEFLTILDAVRATAIVGADARKLFPPEKEERETILRQGKTLLEQRGLLTADRQFHPDLLRAARIIASPQVAMIIIRNVIALGPQLFVLYQSQEGFIEHTCPKEDIHRLAIIPDMALLLLRATQILSLPDRDALQSSVQMEQEKFFKLYELTQHHRHEPALDILQHTTMPSTAAEALVVAMEQPTFSGHAVLLKCAEQTIVDVRDVVVVQDERTAWYAMQITPGQPLLRIESVHARAMHAVLSQCYAELADQHSVTREV